MIIVDIDAVEARAALIEQSADDQLASARDVPVLVAVVRELEREVETLRSACLLVLRCENGDGGATLLPESVEIVSKAIEETQ